MRPRTDLLPDLDKNDDGSLMVDETLRVAGRTGLFAAGDIATFPDPVSRSPIRIEHWRLAQQHGRVAAANMARPQPMPFDKVPFFWTGQYDLKLRYVGHAGDWDEVIIHGRLEADDPDFLALYVQDGSTRAVAGANRDKTLCAVEECLRLGKMPSVQEARDGEIDWEARLH